MHGVLRPRRRHLTFADCELAGRGGFELWTDVVEYASVWGERDRDVILLDSEALRTVCVEERTRVGMGLGGVFAVILDYVIPQQVCLIREAASGSRLTPRVSVVKGVFRLQTCSITSYEKS